MLQPNAILMTIVISSQTWKQLKISPFWFSPDAGVLISLTDIIFKMMQTNMNQFQVQRRKEARKKRAFLIFPESFNKNVLHQDSWKLFRFIYKEMETGERKVGIMDRW